MSATLSRPDRAGTRHTSDGRFDVYPAYSPSIFGGSVSRPSYWLVRDTATGRQHTARTLADARELIAWAATR